ncbi:unnamed protein product [Arabis nemorensis]|uniref:Uncharacterized protein n=1 Tax=Arabis nemorensis TaxID=586526 RepID=A0A565BJ03_9BRAS|nr:unnamed protein product [Arabis nemorensis]
MLVANASELPVDKKGRTFGIGNYSVSQCNSSPSVNTSTNAMYEEKLEEQETKMTSMQQELDMCKDWLGAKFSDFPSSFPSQASFSNGQ